MKYSRLVPCFALCCLGALVARSQQTARPQAPVAIVELFTSEGCSSCPPADALLRRIQGTEAGSGQTIVGISEHVTYWNHLGWKDPYSADTFTDRQNTYASKLSVDGPYTPQMVLNGRAQFVGSDARALDRALQEDARSTHASLRVLSSSVQGNSLVAEFALAGTASMHPLDVIAVLTDDVDRSNVLHGENAGRDLQHVSVARSLARVAAVHGDARQTVRIVLPPAFLSAGSGHHLVLFVQEPHQGSIVAAATAPIS